MRPFSGDESMLLNFGNRKNVENERWLDAAGVDMTATGTMRLRSQQSRRLQLDNMIYHKQERNSAFSKKRKSKSPKKRRKSKVSNKSKKSKKGRSKSKGKTKKED